MLQPLLVVHLSFNSHMAEGFRRSNRTVTLKRDPNFIYDEDCLKALVYKRIDTTEVWHHSSSEESLCIPEQAASLITVGLPSQAVSNWTVLENLPNIINNLSLSKHNSSLVNSAPAISHLSQSQDPEASASNNNNKTSQILSDSVRSVGRSRHYSSTRGDFLEPSIRESFQDLEGNFLSESPAVFSEMSAEEGTDIPVCSECEGETCDKCTPPPKDDLSAAMWAAVGQMETLTKKVTSLEQHIITQNIRLTRLEGSSNEGSSQGSGKKDSQNKSRRHKDITVKDSIKKDRVEDEKDRQFKVLQDKIRARNRGKIRVSSDGDSDSAEEVDLKALRKKMTRKQREDCNNKVSAKLKQIGATFPEDDSTSSSGTDSDYVKRSCHSRRKVRSGAKVKKRPVVKTELWPHTVANEDDGEEVDSETISLAKFFACFTYIMLNCGRAESAGRSALLHAVSTVLEYLPWAEARNFHNLVMVKLEQGRANWSSDFLIMADQFIDKKARQNLRSKGSSVGTAATYKANANRSYGKGFGNSASNWSYGKGFGNSYNKNSDNRNKSLYAVVCKQWNNGSCTYGDRCKRWHVCWSCAKAGKMGEPHKSSSHQNSGHRSGQSEQRV